MIPKNVISITIMPFHVICIIRRNNTHKCFICELYVWNAYIEKSTQSVFCLVIYYFIYMYNDSLGFIVFFPFCI